MRSIIFLSVMNGAGWGGSEEQWYQLALYYAKQKLHTAAVLFDWSEKADKIKALQNAGCQVYLLPQKNKSLLYKWKLRQELNKIPFREYDHAFVNQGGWEDLLHAPLKMLNQRLPSYTLCFHNYQTGGRLSAKKLGLFKSWVNNAMLNLSDAQKTFDVLESNFNLVIPCKKVMYNPITFPVPLTASPYPNNKTVHFIMLAALDKERKAQDILIETLSSQKWAVRNWVLELYGDGCDRKLLEQLIHSKKLEHKIFLKGHTNQVQQVLLSANLVLQCTHIDAMPISVTEAMAMARPCLVSNVGDMPLWVNDKNGFVCQDVSILSLDNTLEKAWQLIDQWQDLGKEAFMTFKKMYPQPYIEKLALVVEHPISNSSRTQ